MEKDRSSTQHFVALDSLRGVCASIVVFFHVEGDAAIKSIPVVTNGFLFVDFFFVLSGFVIAASYRNKLIEGYSLVKFMLLRLGRLYPLHIFMLAAYLIVATAKYFSGSPSNYTPLQFLGSTLLLQAWELHPGTDLNPWNPPSWSISAEFWTYLIFAVSCLAFRRKSLMAFGVLILLSAPVLLFASDRAMNVCFNGSGIARCVYGFSFGVIAFSIWQSNWLVSIKTFRGLATSVEVMCIAASMAIVAAAGSSKYGLLCPIVFSATVVVFAYQAGAISRFLLTRPLALIGTLSYSIYMTHEFIFARFCNALTVLIAKIGIPIFMGKDGFSVYNLPGWHGLSDVVALVFYAIVLVTSYATYRLVENPMRAWSRKAVSAPGSRTRSATAPA